MARKSADETLFKLLANAPWQLGLGLAIFFFIFGSILGGLGPSGTPAQIFGGFGRIILYLLAGSSLFAAIVSASKQFLRRHLLDTQTDLTSIRNLSWREFEQLVGEAYRRQGYTVEETGGGGADGGIDLILRGHGETVLVQCKQWRTQQVGVTKVRELFGVLTAEYATRAILVTSGRFTQEAQTFATAKPLVLVDGPALTTLVRQVRTQPATINPPPVSSPSTVAPFESPNATPPACPKCNAPMILRTARRGTNTDHQFYGCTRYPDCKGIQNTL